MSRPVRAYHYRNPVPKDQRCESCDRFRRAIRITATAVEMFDGSVRSSRVSELCEVCAKVYGFGLPTPAVNPSQKETR